MYSGSIPLPTSHIHQKALFYYSAFFIFSLLGYDAIVFISILQHQIDKY